MPVWLSFFLALILAGGFFATLFGLVTALVEGRRAKAAPRLGISQGENSNSLGVWVDWETSQFAIEIYRLRFQYLSPFSLEKEGTFTVSFETPQTASFFQVVELPERFLKLLRNEKETPHGMNYFS
jgi:hypothetical protein